MIFTLAGNRRRIEDAAAKAREEGRREGLAIGREEGRRHVRQEIVDWYAAAKADWAAVRIPNPPPILGDDGGGPPG